MMLSNKEKHMANTTLKNAILRTIKNRPVRGATVTELFSTLSKQLVNDDGTEVKRTSVRARTYELFSSFAIDAVGTRNGATVYKANPSL
jgi:transcriptional regulator NrdR family protein